MVVLRSCINQATLFHFQNIVSCNHMLTFWLWMGSAASFPKKKIMSISRKCDQTVKLWPKPQVIFDSGFLNWNPCIVLFSEFNDTNGLEDNYSLNNSLWILLANLWQTAHNNFPDMTILFNCKEWTDQGTWYLTFSSILIKYHYCYCIISFITDKSLLY